MIPHLAYPFSVSPGRYKTIEDHVRELITPAIWIPGDAVDLSGNGYTVTPQGSAAPGDEPSLIPGDDDGASTNFDGAGYLEASYSPFVNGTVRTWLMVLESAAGVNGNLFQGAGLSLLSNADTSVTWTASFAEFDSWPAGTIPVDTPLFLAFKFDEPGNSAELSVNGISLGARTHSAAYPGSPGDLIFGSGFEGKMQHMIVVEGEVEPSILGKLSDLFLTGEVDLLTSARAATVDQGSPDEVAQCVYAVLATAPGDRAESPEFGFAPQLFRQGGVDLEELRRTVEDHEPRANVLTDAEMENLTETVRVTLL